MPEVHIPIISGYQALAKRSDAVAPRRSRFAAEAPGWGFRASRSGGVYFWAFVLEFSPCGCPPTPISQLIASHNERRLVALPVVSSA